MLEKPDKLMQEQEPVVTNTTNTGLHLAMVLMDKSIYCTLNAYPVVEQHTLTEYTA
jgi:hypothetical protein